MSVVSPAGRLAKRVVLVGLDAADWNLITPLLEAGQMPNLARFVDAGVMGNLASLQPMISPMLWTSIATGKRPFKHGIHGFVEPDPSGRTLRAVSSTTRTTKALWNILSQCGLRSVVVGWYAGHPVEPILGVAVSEHFPKAVGSLDDEWPLPSGMVHPPEMGDALQDLRVHPAEIDGYSLLPFVPAAAGIDQTKDPRLGLLARDLAECVTTQTATTWLMENAEWDFLATYFPAIDHICHKFMHYHPPRMAGIPAEDFELYREVVAETYRFHDAILGRIVDLAGEDTTIILCSDHGYRSDHLRPSFTPDLPSGPVMWHRPYGILAMRGPGIAKDELIYGARILDIAPTILHLFGLPVGADMDGRVLAEALADRIATVPAVPSWDEISGESGQHPADARLNTWDSAAALEQLVDLGYVAPRAGDVEADVKRARLENQYNLAVSLIDGDQVAEAVELLEPVYRDSPQNALFGLHLASAYQRVGRRPDARRIIETVLARSQDESAEPFGQPKGAAIRWGKSKESPRLMPNAELLLGMLDLDDGKLESAIEHLSRAERSGNAPPETYSVIGQTWLRMRRWQDAAGAFERTLALNPDDARAHAGLAEAFLGLRRNEEAAEQALSAVVLRYHFGAAQFTLGVALFRLRELGRSRQAFEQCVALGGSRAPIAKRWVLRLRLIEEHASLPEKS